MLDGWARKEHDATVTDQELSSVYFEASSCPLVGVFEESSRTGEISPVDTTNASEGSTRVMQPEGDVEGEVNYSIAGKALPISPEGRSQQRLNDYEDLGHGRPDDLTADDP